MADDVPLDTLYLTLLTCFWITIFNRLAPMADLENLDSPQAKLFSDCRRGFRTRDLELIASTIHKDFRYFAYPKSLGKPEQTKEEWLNRWAGLISLWTADLEVSYLVAPQTSFAATKSLLQQTYRFIIDTPGTAVAHVRI
jgi:hypothetical protein